MLSTLLSYIRSFTRFAGTRAVYAALLVLAGAVLEGIGLLAILPLLEIFGGEVHSGISQALVDKLESVGLTERQPQLLAVLSILLVAIAGRNLIVWLRTVRVAEIGYGFVDHWRVKMFKAMSQADWSRLLALHQHDAQHAIVNDVTRLSVGTDRLLRGMAGLIFIAVQLIVALLVSPGLTILILAVLLLAGLALPFFSGRARKFGKRQTAMGKRLHETLHQFLSALKLMKIHDAEHAYLQQFEQDVRRLRSHVMRFVSDQAAANALFQLLGACFACILIVVGLFLLDTPVMTLATMLVIMTRFSAPVFSMLQGFQAMSNMLPAFESLLTLERALQKRSDERDRHPPPVMAGTEPAIHFPLSMKLENISFHYPGQSENVVSDLTIAVQSGEMVALSGPSGSGKTTIMDLAVGLLRPDSGDISINGRSVIDDMGATVRSRISYVPQDSLLFDRSVRENLLWHDIEADEEEIHAALTVVRADSVVARLPEGLDTRAGERGQKFSGGERQRLAIARAILRKPGLLILDEATNALDVKTEQLIFEGLARLTRQMTVLVITHRPASPALFDRLYWLSEGKAVAQSPPAAQSWPEQRGIM